MAEEEAVEDFPLTYDRPDLCNKVTLRRSSTGMWKVCSSGQKYANERSIKGKQLDLDNDSTKEAVIASHKQSVFSSVPCGEKNVKTGTLLDNAKSKRHLKDDDPEYQPKAHHKSHRACNKSCVGDSSMKHSEGTSDCHSRTHFRSKNEVHISDQSFVHELDVASHKPQDCNATVSCSPRQNSASTTSCTELLAHDASLPNHKYPTRHKFVLT